MAQYKMLKKMIVLGKKKVIYSKSGTKKLYVKSKGRMMNLVKYKKMKNKKTKQKQKQKSNKKKGGHLVELYPVLAKVNSYFQQ